MNIEMEQWFVLVVLEPSVQRPVERRVFELISHDVVWVQSVSLFHFVLVLVPDHE